MADATPVWMHTWMNGFPVGELGNWSTGIFTDPLVSPGPAPTSGPGESYAWRSSSNTQVRTPNTGLSIQAGWATCWVNVQQWVPTGNRTLLGVENSDSEGIVRLRTEAGVARLYVSGTPIGAINQLNVGQWYYLAIRWDINQVTREVQTELWVDGKMAISGSGTLTVSETPLNIDHIYTYGQHDYGSLILWDGIDTNTPASPMYAVTLPDTAASSSDWTASAGTLLDVLTDGDPDTYAEALVAGDAMTTTQSVRVDVQAGWAPTPVAVAVQTIASGDGVDPSQVGVTLVENGVDAGAEATFLPGTTPGAYSAIYVDNNGSPWVSLDLDTLAVDYEAKT